MKNRYIILLFIAFFLLSYMTYHGVVSKREKPKPSYTQSALFQNLNSELKGVRLPVKGEIPSWVEGTFVRNGPAKFHAGDDYLSHWFDGLAMLHAFTINQGEVVYSNKFLESTPYKKWKKTGELSFPGFAEDPCRSIFKDLFTFFLPKDDTVKIHNANVNVAKIAEHYVAMTETPLPVRFDIETLETLGVLDYDDNFLKKDCFESAHPHYEKDTNDIINYYVEFGKNSYYVLYRIPNGTTRRKIIAKIPVDKPAYIHSFALTDKYIVFVEFPFVVSPLDLKLKRGGFITHFKWEPERGTRFDIVDKETGSTVKSLTGDPIFSFHHVNAFEKDGAIVVDLIGYPDVSVISDASNDTIERYLTRYTLDLESEKVESRKVLGNFLEMPHINYESNNGQAYHYCYAIGFSSKIKSSDEAPLVKVDVETGDIKTWQEEGCYPSEPVFLPKSNSNVEDEGVVLSVVLDSKKERSFLLVLDGETFVEIARAEVPHQIPFGLHGMFFGS